MVKALHRAGIEVILDVVFNHTTEGDQRGPTVSFRGFGNGTYYLVAPQDQQWYLDFSGCGNTFDANHPVVEKLIGDCLDFWVGQMHVDGFRFDEASILTRDEHGQKMDFPPVVWHIELAETLAGAKAIAEPWDAGSLYEVGDFPERWAAWNDRFRDTIRRFVRGDRGWFDGKTLVGRVADVISGSADVFAASDRIVGRCPANGVNFVTAHDGFTLNDLVSYDGKHNEANGEGNRDGNDNNLSWNCGVEGRSSDPGIEALRLRQIQNFAAILLLSQGVPMILMGDEVRRTQGGNNNAYCQDNETSWFDWSQVDANRGLLRFFRRMIALRKRHPSIRCERFFDGKVNERGLPDVTWHGCRLGHPGWSDPSSAVLAFTLGGFAGEPDLHVMLNMDGQDLDFDLPPVPGRSWFRVVDTSLASPDDVVEPGREVEITTGGIYRVNARSVVVLMSKDRPAADANGSAATSTVMESTEWSRSTSPSRTPSPAT
jgi:glycogen operon protein